MALKRNSFRRRLGRLLESLNPLRANRVRRFRRCFPMPGSLPLNDRQTVPIVSQLVGLFRSLLRTELARRPGMDLGFIRLTTEALEPRRLLTSNPLYVAHLASDPNSPSNYWVDAGNNAVTFSTPYNTSVHLLNGPATPGATWQDTAFNTPSHAAR